MSINFGNIMIHRTYRMWQACFLFPSSLRCGKLVFFCVRKSHIACLSLWGAVYISVGQLHLVPIDFKMKSNMVSELIVRLSFLYHVGCKKQQYLRFSSSCLSLRRAPTYY